MFWLGRPEFDPQILQKGGRREPITEVFFDCCTLTMGHYTPLHTHNSSTFKKQIPYSSLLYSNEARNPGLPNKLPESLGNSSDF